MHGTSSQQPPVAADTAAPQLAVQSAVSGGFRTRARRTTHDDARPTTHARPTKEAQRTTTGKVNAIGVDRGDKDKQRQQSSHACLRAVDRALRSLQAVQFALERAQQRRRRDATDGLHAESRALNVDNHQVDVNALRTNKHNTHTTRARSVTSVQARLARTESSLARTPNRAPHARPLLGATPNAVRSAPPSIVVANNRGAVDAAAPPSSAGDRVNSLNWDARAHTQTNRRARTHIHTHSHIKRRSRCNNEPVSGAARQTQSRRRARLPSRDWESCTQRRAARGLGVRRTRLVTTKRERARPKRTRTRFLPGARHHCGASASANERSKRAGAGCKAARRHASTSSVEEVGVAELAVAQAVDADAVSLDGSSSNASKRTQIATSGNAN